MSLVEQFLTVNGKTVMVPSGWSVDNWSGRRIYLDDNYVLESEGELRVVFEEKKESLVLCRDGKPDSPIGCLEHVTHPAENLLRYEHSYVDHTCSVLFVTMEMAYILSEKMDLEMQEWKLFGVDHRGKVHNF